MDTPLSERLLLMVGISIALAGCIREPERTFKQCLNTGPPLDTQQKLEAKVAACIEVARTTRADVSR